MQNTHTQPSHMGEQLGLDAEWKSSNSTYNEMNKERAAIGCEGKMCPHPMIIKLKCRELKNQNLFMKSNLFLQESPLHGVPQYSDKGELKSHRYSESLKTLTRVN